MFPVQNSTLSAKALADLVRREYPLPAAPTCTFWRKGMSDAYRLEAGDRLYFLKVSMADRRSRKDIDEEVRLLDHLHRGGVSVAAPVKRRDGRYVGALDAPEGERHAVLYEGARGVDGTTEAHRRALGQMVARMHECADRMEPAYERDDGELEHLLDDNLAAIASLMAHRREDFEVISGIAAQAKETVSALLPRRAPEHGVCHGDLHGGDVLYSSDGTPTIFDFDHSGLGWRALDLAVFGGTSDWMDVSPETEVRRQRDVAQFLEGYSTVRELSEGERKVIRLGRGVRHIFLMGIVLRCWTIRDGCHWANDDFIDWHMIWFRRWAETQR